MLVWSMRIYERRNTMKEKWGYQTVAISIWGLAWKIITITLKQENLGTAINNREQYVRLNDFNAKYPRLLSIMYVISYLPRFHGFFFLHFIAHTCRKHRNFMNRDRINYLFSFSRSPRLHVHLASISFMLCFVQ